MIDIKVGEALLKAIELGERYAGTSVISGVNRPLFGVGGVTGKLPSSVSEWSRWC
jgi:hypothetical protein